MEKGRIIFLGSGGGRKVTASQVRATGGFVVQLGNEQLHFDPGPGAIVRAAQFGVDIKNTTGILISHFHIDHCNDVNILIDAVTFGGKEKKGVLVTSMYRKKNNLTKFHRDTVEKHIRLKPCGQAKVRGFVVKATRTERHGSYTIGYKVSTPGLVFGYTSDTSFFPGLVDEFNGCDILIVNTLKPKGMLIEGHMSSDDAARLLKGVKPKLAILHHFGRSMLEADPVKEAFNVERESGVKTLAASDGLVVDFSPYCKI